MLDHSTKPDLRPLTPDDPRLTEGVVAIAVEWLRLWSSFPWIMEQRRLDLVATTFHRIASRPSLALCSLGGNYRYLVRFLLMRL
jgi:hypothetical protein